MKDYLNKENQRLLDKYGIDGLFPPDYVKYDSGGVKHTGCMRCGTAVIVRQQDVEKCPHCGKEILVQKNTLKELSNHRKVRKDIVGGSYVELISCEECVAKLQDMSIEEEKRIVAQIAYGTAKDMTFGKKHKNDIKKQVERMEKMEFEKPEKEKHEGVLPTKVKE